MATPVPGQPTPQQMAQIQQQIAEEARRQGLTIPEFQARQRQQIEAEAQRQGITPQELVQRHQQAFREQMAMQRQGQANGQPPQGQVPHQQQVHQQQIPVNPGAEAKPEALAVAKFLRSQDLKTRTVIMEEKRRDMFKVKRATRALLSPAYQKARSKNPLLPIVDNEQQARGAIQLLPLSMLALRVSKADPHEGHDHAKPKKDPKRIKGQWTVKVERQQDFEPQMHYVWLYEGPQWKKKVYAGLALAAVMTIVMFPLWPLVMRQGVWYLSVGAMGLLGLFFAMAIFRLILFVVTLVVLPPGFWLFPNLFEDVGFFDSFRPVCGWHDRIYVHGNKIIMDGKVKDNKGKGRKSKKAVEGGAAAPVATETSPTANGSATTSSAAPTSVTVSRRPMAAQVEDVEDE